MPRQVSKNMLPDKVCLRDYILTHIKLYDVRICLHQKENYNFRMLSSSHKMTVHKRKYRRVPTRATLDE